MQFTLSFFQLITAINKSSYITKFKSIFNDKIKKKKQENIFSKMLELKIDWKVQNLRIAITPKRIFPKNHKENLILVL